MFDFQPSDPSHSMIPPVVCSPAQRQEQPQRATLTLPRILTKGCFPLTAFPAGTRGPKGCCPPITLVPLAEEENGGLCLHGCGASGCASLHLRALAEPRAAWSRRCWLLAACTDASRGAVTK